MTVTLSHRCAQPMAQSQSAFRPLKSAASPKRSFSTNHNRASLKNQSAFGTQRFSHSNCVGPQSKLLPFHDLPQVVPQKSHTIAQPSACKPHGVQVGGFLTLRKLVCTRCHRLVTFLHTTLFARALSNRDIDRCLLPQARLLHTTPKLIASSCLVLLRCTTP
jgi:hypothetical protein